MNCRRMKGQDIVWFGSYGKNSDGTAKFYNENDKHDNYADKQQGVRDSLEQRLSVIEGELWYDIEFGLPLLDKIKSKALLDARIASAINAHPDVQNILKFESSINNNHYSCETTIETIYGNIDLVI